MDNDFHSQVGWQMEQRKRLRAQERGRQVRATRIKACIAQQRPADEVGQLQFDFTTSIQASGTLEGTRWGTVSWVVITDQRKKTSYFEVRRQIFSDDSSWFDEERFYNLGNGIRFLQWVLGTRSIGKLGTRSYSSAISVAVVAKWWEDDVKEGMYLGR